MSSISGPVPDGAGPPLTGLRVLECGDTLASAYAGRLLADLGADVLLVEDVGGHPLRAVGPYVGANPGRDRSAAFAYFAAGKQSVCVDTASASGAAAIADLASRADVVIRSTCDGRDWWTEDAVAAACAADPGLIVADISTFGRPAGGDRHPTSDLLALAAGGLLSVNATAPCDPTATPLRYRGELSSVHAAAGTAVAILGALFERRRSGLGQRVDISSQAAISAILATALASFTYNGVVPVPDGRRGVAPWGFFACKDGMVLLQVTEDSQWRSLVKMLGDPEWGHLEVFATTAQRIDVMGALDPLVAEAIAEFTTEDFLAACREAGVASGRIHTAKDLIEWEHLHARGYLQPITVDDGHYHAEVLAPTPPWRLHRTAPLERGPSPRLGEHVAGPWPGAPERPAPVAPPTASEGAPVAAPLAGLKVVDLTWVWAGPYSAMQLAHLGAEVVKVESSVRLDVTRVLGPFADGEIAPDNSGYFNQYNLGKQSVLLDLKADKGKELLRGLLAQADIVIDNMRAGALDRMGFSYAELRQLNPKIVAVSMTGFGESGPERDRMAYGSLIDSLSGVASSNGPVGGGPTDFVMSLPDPAAGIHTAVATLAALYRAQVSGQGERVEVSMLEASVSAFPWPVLYQGVEGHGVPVDGNRDEARAPHDVYRCLGHYEWVAIAVDDDEQFAALARAIGRPELAVDDRFATLLARRRHADDLDEILSAWTAPLEAADAAAELRAVGVPAERVRKIDELVESAPLLARRFFVDHEHPTVGVRKLAGPAWRASRSPMTVAGPAPRLGQHSRTVLARWLGLSDAELDELDAANILR